MVHVGHRLHIVVVPTDTDLTTNAGHPRPVSPFGFVALATVAGCAVGCILAAVIHFLISGEESTPLGPLAAQQSLYFGVWGTLVAPLWIAFGRVERVGNAWARAGLIAAAGVASWLVHSMLVYTLTPLLLSTPRSSASLATYALRTIYIESIVFAGVAGALIGARYRINARVSERRAAALAVQLSQSHVRALQAQLHPHFLFNALHTVGMLARSGDTGRVVEVTARLADLLRIMLDDNDDDAEWTVRDELELAKRYLAIELVRFGDRLHVDNRADDDVLGGLVPRFVLQPIIENAMRHGVGRSVKPGLIDIHARCNDDCLMFVVSDDGPGEQPAPVIHADGRDDDVRRPLGLALTRERLAGLYGLRASLTVERRNDGGTTVTINVPWHTKAIDGGVRA